jgi:TolB-like protein
VTPERWQDVERLYHEALQREPEVRAAFLDEMCGPDAELLAEVQSLLGAGGRQSTFLETSVLQDAARRLALGHSGRLAPRRVGRFEILSLVGAGGMGEVYHAHDRVLERDVALKLLHPVSSGEPVAPDLLREAQSAARLSHPNICTVHEVGSFDGCPYLAMEYVEGQTLAQKLKDGPLPLDRVLDYGIQIARALGHAHDRQILHKDLKSANVIVTADHRVKVVDFGIAKRMDPSGVEQATLGRATPVRVLAGTPACMAPEVLRGEPADVRSDVWAMGVILFEMSSGECPFRGLTPVEVGAAIMHGSSAATATRITPALRPIVQRCLSVNPVERFQRLADVCAALERVRAAAIPASAAPLHVEAHPRANRHPRARGLLLAALAAGGLLAVAMAGWWALVRARPAAPGPGAAGSPIRLAILPFQVDAAGDIGLGLTDSLITRLAGLRAFHLLPSAAVRRLAGSHRDPAAAARELGVDYLLYGTATSRDDDYDFNLQLVRATDGRLVWGHQLRMPRTGLLEVEELIGDKVVSALKVPMTRNEREGLTRRPTASPEAHVLYITGRALMVTHEHPDRALRAFEAAVRLDPKYALAQAGLAHVLARKYWHPESPEAAARYRARAMQAAEEGLRLDANLAEAHEALSTIFRYSEAEWDKTIDESRKALELKPTLELPHHNMATAFYHLGLPEFSDQESLDGIQANPASRAHALLNRARAALYDGRFPAAYQFIGEVEPSDDPGAAWVLAEVRFYLGRRQESEDSRRSWKGARPLV